MNKQQVPQVGRLSAEEREAVISAVPSQLAQPLNMSESALFSAPMLNALEGVLRSRIASDQAWECYERSPEDQRVAVLREIGSQIESQLFPTGQ